MTDIADKIYAATGLTLGAEAAAAIEKMIQVENEKLRAALRVISNSTGCCEGCECWRKLRAKARAALGEKE